MSHFSDYFRAGELSESEAELLIKESKAQTQAIRDKMDKEKQKSAEDLHKKLNDRKKKRMEEKVGNHWKPLD